MTNEIKNTRWKNADFSNQEEKKLARKKLILHMFGVKVIKQNYLFFLMKMAGLDVL